MYSSTNGRLCTMRYTSRHTYSWSSNIAYAVGLMASDGCLSSDMRHLDLTSVDKEQLHNFSSAMGRETKITKKQSGTGNISYRLQFSDAAFYDFLLAAGLSPNKSTTLGEMKIPEKYYRDFLRGVFDGDGTCYSYFDPRWKSSYMFYVGFTSASKRFLLYLREKNSSLAKTNYGSLRNASRSHILTYAKSDSLLLRDFMYHNTNVVALQRKKRKLESFISKNQNDKIRKPTNARVLESVDRLA